MPSFFEDDSPSNQPEYSVSELSGAIKRTIENNFEHVRLRGEISGYRGQHSSGHAYFSLKDDKSRIEAVIWKGSFGKLKFKPEEGMEVIATGKVTTFPGSSKYQIVIEQMEPAGAGAMMALLEERRRKLAAEGLFDPARKQELPFLPRVIGVITSPTGAVIRDILHRIADRFPVHVIVWPVKVQGDGCGEEVAAAIRGFNELQPGGPIARPDVLIVARGGGSLEDLWGFNDEAVVRAAANSMIPLISAVGHETDWTLIDHASDRRAPTPTGAAEIAVPVKAELDAQVAALAARLSTASVRQMDIRRNALRALARALPSLDGLMALPRRRFDEAATGLVRGLSINTVNKRAGFDRIASRLRPDILAGRIAENRRLLGEAGHRADLVISRLLDRSRQRITGADASLRSLPARIAGDIGRQSDRLSNISRRSDSAIRLQLERARTQWTGGVRMLESLSYKNVLKRGFAIVRDENDKPLGLAEAMRADQPISIEFSDGRVTAITTSGEAPSTASRKKPAPKSSGSTGPGQGSLF